MKKKAYVVAIGALFLISFLIINGDIKTPAKKNTPSYAKPVSVTPQKNYQEISSTVKYGETLYTIFKRKKLNLQELFKIKHASAKVYRLSYLFPGQRYRITVSKDTNKILSLVYWIDEDHLLKVYRTSDDNFEARKVPVPYEKRILHLGGIIDDNLISAMRDFEDGFALAMKISDIFAWDVDFSTDLRKGDMVRVVVEGLYLDGKFKKYGDILSVELINNGTSYKAYRFVYKGLADYYDDHGRSLRRAFLKAPLSFRRISSGFTKRRFHPILKRFCPHYGIDYAAPYGTPVSATGDGTVIFAGRKGGYGKLVIIRHPNGYKTYYGHLSRIARRIRRGKKVRQGEMIGYVGATGLATGPHLHYEMRIHNKPVNPLRIRVPRGRNIPRRLLARFKRFKEQMDSQLASIKPPVEASRVY